MKRFEKFLLFMLSLVGLAVSVCLLALFYRIPLVTYWVEYWKLFIPWLDYIFAGYIAFMGLFFFVLLLISLFAPSKLNDLVMVKDKGKLKFSRQTVESTARYSFADVEHIESAKVKAKIHRIPEKTKIYVKLSVRGSNGLIDLVETVQNRIGNAFASSIGVTVKAIHIKVNEISQGAGFKQEAAEPQTHDNAGLHQEAVALQTHDSAGLHQEAVALQTHDSAELQQEAVEPQTQDSAEPAASSRVV